MPHPKVFVLYDRWFTDESYRKSISEQLGLEFSDKGLNNVMRVGRGRRWGSSFDKMKFQGKAQDMKTTERWKEYLDDPIFVNEMANTEVRRLSEQLFGEFPKELG
jgi:hypothetical protein